MKVILTTDVPKLGNKDDVLELKDGFAHNVLLSKGKAILATPQALSSLESKKLKREREKQEENKNFASFISLINDKKILINSKANEKGVLFKSISPKDIATEIKKVSGKDIDPNLIIVDHIKNIGSHKIIIKKGDIQGECEILVQ